MVPPEVAAVCGAVFGLAAGSFVNVILYRVPRRLSLVWPPSGCPACGRRLRPLELVPVFSYLLLRGRCAGCRRSIGWRYPTVELLVATVAALTGLYGGLIAAASGIGGLVVGAYLLARAGRRVPPEALDSERGSLLLEVALVGALFTVVIASLLSLSTYSLGETTEAMQRVSALNLVRARLEWAKQIPAPSSWAGLDANTETALTAEVLRRELRDAQGQVFAQVRVLNVRAEYDRHGRAGSRVAVRLATIQGDRP